MKKMSFTKISFPQRFSQSVKSRPHTIKPMPGRHAVNSHGTPHHTRASGHALLAARAKGGERKGRETREEERERNERRDISLPLTLEFYV
jgi:hypothetical protein